MTFESEINDHLKNHKNDDIKFLFNIIIKMGKEIERLNIIIINNNNNNNNKFDPRSGAK